jgi:hypothetical protein
MFFLLRAAFWMGLVLLLLPADRTERPPIGGGGSMATSDAIEAAQSTLRDLEGFCDRHTLACASGRAVAEDVGARALDGLRRARERAEPAVATPHPARETPAETTTVARAPRAATVPMPQPKPLS